MVACIVAQSLIATFSSRRSRQSSQDPEEIEHMPCDDGGGKCRDDALTSLSEGEAKGMRIVVCRLFLS